MKLEEILQLDCRKQEDKDLLRKVLIRLPFFKDRNPDSINNEDLERAVFKMSTKYPVNISYIMASNIQHDKVKKDENFFFTFMIKGTKNGDWLKSVYGVSMFEGFAKITIFMYWYIKNKIQKEEE